MTSQQKLQTRDAASSNLPKADLLIELAERGRLPDALIRFGIRRLCRSRLEQELHGSPEKQQQRFQNLISELHESPIAIETQAANQQHYEIPTEFYLASLGKRLKYSCAYYPEPHCTLDEAEEHMLRLYTERAQLCDGQQILELGCGWGSLTFWMAENFPASRITAISNSATQKTHIEEQCVARDIDNIRVITADVTTMELPADQFDRVVSVEMFEHMRNYAHLLRKISRWLKPEGKLFVHIFAHRYLMYPFEVKNQDDWMSKYFFTGGLMPSVDTLLHFQENLSIESRWLVNGQHYAKTCRDWLVRTDANRGTIIQAFNKTYGEQQALRWFHRWRMFYMACEELFAFNGGSEWMVAHYLFANRSD